MSYKSLVQATPAGLALVLDGQIMYANPAFSAYAGVSESDVIGSPIAKIFPESQRAMVEDVVLPTLTIRGRWRGLIYDTSPEKIRGDLVIELREVGVKVLATLWPLLRPDESASGIRRANAELTLANRIKDTFLANVSHDLRSPLATIMGASEALIEGIYGDLNGDQLRGMLDIAATSAHLLSLINDLLDLSSVRFGAFELRRETVNLSQLVKSVSEMQTTEMRGNGISIEVSLPEQEIQLCADPSRLRQVLINLVENAVKFSHPKGVVRLVLTLTPDQRAVSVIVHDDGIGIPKDQLSSIFEPFVRVETSKAGRRPGTGLGLAIVQRIVDLHGGIISVTSEVGKGSTFSVVFPMSTVTMPRPAVPDQVLGSELVTSSSGKESSSSLSPASDRVLFIVDDNAMQCELLAGFAKRAGLQVSSFGSGKDCLKGLNEVWPDIAIVDIHMPEMDGLELIRLIRDLESSRNVPIFIIALTALSMPGDRELCLAAGADIFFSKPVVYRDLVDYLTTQHLR